MQRLIILYISRGLPPVRFFSRIGRPGMIFLFSPFSSTSFPPHFMSTSPDREKKRTRRTPTRKMPDQIQGREESPAPSVYEDWVMSFLSVPWKAFFSAGVWNAP